MKISGDVHTCAKWAVPLAGLGPNGPAAGIWRPIRLEAYSTRIADFRLIDQEHRRNGDPTVDIQTTCVNKAAATQEVIISLGNNEITRRTLSPKNDKASVKVEIPDPQLWWPNGLGEQTPRRGLRCRRQS